MSNYVDVIDSILLQFDTLWGNTTEIVYDESNVEEKVQDPKISWVRLSINPNTSFSASVGNNGLNRHEGLITIQVFSPIGDDALENRSLVDQAINVFDRTRFSIIRCDVAHVSKPVRDGGWFFKVITVPYKADIASN